MKKAFTVFLLAFITLAGSEAVHAQEAGPQQTLTAKKFNRKMKQPGIVVLDVRTAEEYGAGHLPGAVLMDFKKEDFAQKLDSLDKTKTYLIYCKSGRRSQQALELFNSKGFPSVYHLKDGYSRWKGKAKK